MAKKTYYRYDKDTGELDFYFGDDFQETPSAGIPLQAAQKFYKNRNLQNFDYQSRDTSGVSNQEVADRSYYGIQRYRPNNKQSGRYSSYRDEDSGTSTTRRSQQKRDTTTKLSEFADWAKQLRQSKDINTREASKKSTEYRDYLEKNKRNIDSATLAQAKRLLDFADKEISDRQQKGLDERRSGTPVNGNRKYKGVNQYTSESDLIKNVQQQSSIMEQERERQRQQEQAEYDRKTAEYEDLLNRKDFALNSLYKKSDNPMLAENALYEYVNNNADVRRLAEDYGYTGLGNTGFSIDNDKTYIENMSPNEIRTFNYLDATEGREAAEEYLQHIRPQLTERQRTERTDIFEKEAEKDPVASSVASVLMKPFSAFSYAGQAADLIANGNIDQNAAYNQYSYVPTAIRDKVSKKVEEKFGQVGSFAYQTGMSMADFLYLGGMTGGLGAVGEPLMLGIMGSGAAADKVIEAKDDGLDDGQAFALGTIAGAAEYITEKISVDALLDDIPKLGKNFAGYFAKNFLAEGSEEVASDLINTVADVAIAKDKSAWRKAIQEYMNQGYSEKEAFARAMADQAKQMGLSFVGGALSGGLMAGGVGAYSIASNVGRSVNEQLNESTVNYDNALADGATRSQISEAQTEVARKKEALKKAMDESNDVDTAFKQGVENYTEAQDLTTDSTADEVVRETAEPASIRLSEENADMGESEASVIPAEETPAKSQSQLDWEASVDAMSTMGENGKEALKELGSVMDANDLADAQSEFTLGYEAGRSARGRNALPRQSFLTEIGYRAGVNDGVSASTERIAAAREAVTPTVQNKLAAYVPTQAGIANTAEELQAYKEIYNPATGQPRLTNEHINKWNTAAKLLGVRVRFTDHLEQNAYIDDNGEVVVAMDADIDNTMDFYLGHEFTHRLQQASPQHYNALVSAVRSSMSPEAWAQAVSDYQSLAKKHGVELSESGAVDEIVADHIGKLLDKDGTALDDFIRQHVGTREGRTLIQKVRDFIRSISRKLHGNEMSKRYSEVEKRLSEALQASYEEVQRTLDQRQAERDQNAQSEAEELSDASLQYSVRKEAPPKKTGIAYKVFLAKAGQLYPPMVANPGGEGTPIGVWLNADAAPLAGLSKTGRPQVQAGGKGTNVSRQTLAYRPGWHLGDIPLATQFAKKNPATGKKELFPANFVWAECEYAMDVDYQAEADEMGYMRTNPDGTYYKGDKYQHSLAGLKKLPKDGYYRYRTNPNPDTVPWVITGAMKVNRVLNDNEVAEICRANGVEPMQRMGGPIDLEKYGLRQSGNKYSYDELIKLENIPIYSSEELNLKHIKYSKELKRKDIYDVVRSNIEKYNKSKGREPRNNILANKQLGDIVIGKNGFKHGLFRLKDDEHTQNRIDAAVNLPTYVENAIVINEAEGMRNGAEKAFIMMGIYHNANGTHIVRMAVNNITHELEELNVLYSIATKKEGAVSDDTPHSTGATSSSEITVADLLELVKKHFPNELSADVAKHFGLTRGESDFERLKYSIRQDMAQLDTVKPKLENLGVAATDNQVVKNSLRSWKKTDIKALKAALKEAGFKDKEIDEWIANVNGVAATVLADRTRLDYVADEHQNALKSNSEYYYTLDLSTLCKKRQLYQGTYNAIMHRLKNEVLFPEDTISLRKMMADMGYEVPCGICYEESRKKNEGKFAKRWLNGYGKRWKGYKNMPHTDPYIPKPEDVTTTDGRAWLRKNHPEALESYLNYQKTRGSANPKVSMTHTDYRGDIMRLTDNDVKNVKHIGGLRIQSFSDFETVHVIDMMQAVMDMSAKKLTAQAYTKVPAFADIFGGTGIKINLSLIGEVDENGNLQFDSKEGMDPKEAFRLRDKYSENVGTILVGANDASILAAWADPRIDMVIPFHRSGWSKAEFERLGLGNYKDFTKGQTERYMMGKKDMALSTASKALGLTGNEKLEPIYAEDYWEDNRSGKENAEAYLKLCAEMHYRPVFYQFLQDNGDGTWSLKEDGSTDGYWKSLIDFKMYDNNGKGAPQQTVKPNFDMDAAKKTMDSFDGDPNALPVAQDVVDKFVKEFKKSNKQYSFRQRDDEYMDAVNRGDMETAQRMVDEAAKEAGYSIETFHGTHANFNKFKKNSHFGTQIYQALDRLGFYNDIIDEYEYDPEVRELLSRAEASGARVMRLFIKANRPLETDDFGDWDYEYLVRKLPEYLPDTDIAWNSLKNVKDVISALEGLGYDSIVYENIKEGRDEDEGDNDAYILFNPNQAKLADPVTYDDNGNVILLSERFNERNEDIRYSIRKDSEGRELTEGQREYFKNSKAVDKDGNLLALYHGTANAGFTTFRPGLIWTTTSRRDADSYGGNWEQKLFNPNERDKVTDVTTGNFTLEKTNSYLKDFHFDSQEDLDEFIQQHPNIGKVADEDTLDEMLWDDEISDDEYDELVRAERDIRRDYHKYNLKHSTTMTIGDILDNPERFDRWSLEQALYAYDSNADVEPGDTAEDLREVIKEIAERDAEEEGEDWLKDFRSLQFKARIPAGESGQYIDRTNNRTYALYANVTNPLIVNANGQNIAQGYYRYVDNAVNGDYDGVIIRNVRVGAYKDVGDVVIAFSPEQVKSVTNQTPTENEDIRYSFRQGVTESDAYSAVYEALDHADKGDDNLIRLSDIPDIITEISGISGDLYVFRNHLYENMVTADRAKEEGRYNNSGHYHGLDEEKMVEALMALNQPDLIVSDGTNGPNPEISLLLPVFDDEDNPIHAVISFYDNEPINGVWSKRPHIAVTFYGHPMEDTERYLGLATKLNNINKEDILYISKEIRANQPVIAQHPALGNITASTLKKNVAQFKRLVNDFKSRNKINYSWRGSEGILDHAEAVADTAALQRQIETLQRQVDELKGEFQQNKGYKASVPASNKSVKDLLARYGVDAHRAGIEIAKTGDDFRKWANQLARNPQESYTAVRAEATKLAYKLMWNSQELIDTGTMVDDAQKLLKEQTIFIDPRIKSDIADFDLLRKEYKGRLNFTYTKGKGRAVDELYQELNTIYPWLFPEDIVNASDQMEQIFSAADAMAYISYNPYSEYDADTVDMVTNDIMNELLGMLGVKNPDSYRDKMEKRIERVKAQRDEKLARVEQHYRDQKEKAKLRRASSEARENLLKVARRLEKMKTTGANRALIEQALGDLDTTARKISGKTLMNLAALRSWVNEQKNVNQDFIIDQNTRNKLERLEKIQHQIEEAGQTLEDVLASGKGWDQFDSIDIMLELTDVLKALETQIRNENRTIDTEDRHDVFIQGDESIEAIDNSYGNNTAFAEFFDKFLFTEAARPSTEMLRICGYNENVPFYQRFLDLTKGQQNMVDYHRRANVRYFDKFTQDKEFIREVSGKHAREIEITGIDQHGKTVTVKVTPDLLMSMYMHSMNDQNTRHVTEGGMRVPDVRLYKDGKIAKAYEKGTLVKMTRTAMRSVAMSNLTQKERAFITAAQQYYSQMSQPEINAVSEKLVGYEIAKVDNYYRIVTDKNWMKTNLDEMKYDGTIEGMGFTKERIAEAKNPIQLIGMISQITTDIDMHSKYVGMAIPVRNFNKVYGVTAKSFDKNGDIESHYDRSVMDTIQSKWGDKANQYIVKMMSDLQNPKRSTDTAFGPVLSKLRSNYAQAVLTLNASVAIKQSASYPTAAAELGWKPLMQALMTANKTKGKDAAWIAQYSPLMRLRAEGYVSQETGDILTEGKKIPSALNWIQKFDIGTVRLLWLASEYSVKETNPELKPGTKEFYEKVGEVHTRVIENTQPNYTSLQRAQILRSDNELVRMLNMFKTQPFQNFNILMEAFGNNRAKSIAYRNNPTEENLRNLKMARRKLGRAVSSQMVASFVFAAMSMLWELFRGKREKYEDEEGKLNWGAWGKAMGLSMISNLGGMLPFGSTFIEAAESTSDKIAKAFGKEAFFDQKFYGLDSGMSVEAINNIITDGSDLVATLIESANALFNSAEAGSSIDWESVLRDAKDAASGFGQMFGIPFDNLFNTSMAMVGDSVKLSDGYFLGKYTQMRLEKGITSFNKNAYANILIQAYKTDRKQYEKLYDIMVNEPGFSSDSKTSEEWVQDKMGALLQQEDRLNNGITDEMWEQYNSIVEKDEKTGKPKRSREAVYEALLQMDLTKEQRAFLFATQTGDSGTSIEAYGEKWNKQHDKEVARSEAGITQAIYDDYLEKKKPYGSLSQDEFDEVVTSMNLNAEQTEALWKELWPKSTYADYKAKPKTKSRALPGLDDFRYADRGQVRTPNTKEGVYGRPYRRGVAVRDSEAPAGSRQFRYDYETIYDREMRNIINSNPQYEFPATVKEFRGELEEMGIDVGEIRGLDNFYKRAKDAFNTYSAVVRGYAPFPSRVKK